MTDIRWVCISDTHFGAENSVLSHVPPGSSEVDVETASPVVAQLIECLRTVLATNVDGRLPTLILNGDILELALANDNIAASVFARFVELALGGEHPVFDEIVYFVPGNHDHHLWETARERQYADYISGLTNNATIDPPWHVTRLFEDDSTTTPEAELLNAVIAEVGLPNVHVRVVYPNLGIMSDDRERVVVIHHGHFSEPLYRLMSALKGALFPRQTPGEEVWDWEADNFAWIDFFWSTLGRSGSAGVDVGLTYAMLGNSIAVGRLAANLASTLTSHLPHPFRSVARIALTRVTRLIARRVAARERSNPALLGPKTAAGLEQYIAGPVRRQLDREEPGASGRNAAFIFGHTHKPFQRMNRIDGFLNTVAIYNSGGWVVDTERSAPFQGGAVILIDESCHVVSLRMYNQADDPSSYSVSLADAGPTGDDAFRTRLEGMLDFSNAPWSTFSAEVGRTVGDRHRQLPEITQRGISLT